jgi:predicted extracellular nuclease
LVDYVSPATRYSYTFDGAAQAIDHILINKPVRERLKKFGFARVDADFPEAWANDPDRPERVSDHDAPIVFLSLDPPPAAAPATTPTPAQ